jgi:hypothetical protein
MLAVVLSSALPQCILHTLILSSLITSNSTIQDVEQGTTSRVSIFYLGLPRFLNVDLSHPYSGEIITIPQSAAHRPEVVNLHFAMKSEETVAGPASFGDSTQDVSTKEKSVYWEGYLDEEYIKKKHSKPIRNTRYLFFSIYRRLFSITFAANMSVFIGLTATHQANTGKIAYAVISNLFVSILMRQEYVINTLFKIFTAWPKSAPLFIRRTSARIFHIGGRAYSSPLLM